MTNNEKIALLKSRHTKMVENGKNIKSPGVLKKIERQIRNLNEFNLNNNQ